MQKWMSEVLESNRSFFLSFSKWWYFMTGPASNSSTCRIWNCWYFYSKFQLVSTFSICSEFCAKTLLLCCGLSYKWAKWRYKIQEINSSYSLGLCCLFKGGGGGKVIIVRNEELCFLTQYITLSNTLTLAPALTNTWQIAMLSILEGSSSQA